MSGYTSGKLTKKPTPDKLTTLNNTDTVRDTDEHGQKQGVALTGRNTTGPPSCAAPGELRCVEKCYRRRQTTTDAREQNSTGPLHYV